ncbi:hypothetical protein [Persicobacter psychrovividus]|uniref:NAD(P)-dependent oxidoreductase n=1 Tax=Persicobacter psychrovividus TaxID=387638 RepID=A0ABN6LCQ1_9BACT|nr:NAD(P)-dependent oxidoreductase [Persicobacter psychrovividus]
MTSDKLQIGIIGCGWFGLPLGSFLTNAGTQIIGTTTQQQKLSLLKDKGIDAFQYRIGLDPLPAAFKACDLVVVNIPPRRQKREAMDYLEAIHQLKDDLLKAEINQVIFISTTGVYNDSPTAVTENDLPDQPENHFHEAELIFKKHFSKVNILRFAGLFGGDRKAGRFLAGKENLEDKVINMLHLDDAIGFTQRLIHQPQPNEDFNVCCPEHPLRSEFYTQAAKKNGLKPPTFASMADRQKMISPQKGITQLGYTYIYKNPLEAL